MQQHAPVLPTPFERALEQARADYDRGYYEAVYPNPATAHVAASSESSSFWLCHRHAIDAMVRGELVAETKAVAS